MNVSIKTVSGEKHDIEVEPTSTVKEVKEKLSELTKNNVELIKLIFSGRVLKNNETLDECDYVGEKNQFMVMMISKKKPKKPTPVSVEETPTPTPTPAPIPSSTPTGVSGLPLMFQQIFQHPQGARALLGAQMYQILTAPGFIERLLSQNPIIKAFSEQHPEEFKSIISDENFLKNAVSMGSTMQSMGMGAMSPQSIPSESQSVIQLTEPEKADVDSLVAMGFDSNEVLQIYMACGKNKEQAANLLLGRI